MPRVSPAVRSGALYLMYYGSLAALLPFLVLYFERSGLSGGQIGVLSGLMPAFILTAGPLWSAVADARGRARGLVVVAALGSAALAALVPTTAQFLPLLAIVAALAFFAAPLAALIDASVLAVLGDARDRYGRIRSWGAVGWGISAPLVGILTESVGLAWAFFSFGMLMTVTAGVAASMPRTSSGPRPRLALAAIVRLFANRAWAPFLTASFAGGVAMQGTSTFLYLRLADLGAGETLVGLAITVATVSEVPVFFATTRLLRRWPAQTLLLAALGVFAVRLIAYGLVAAPIALVAMQLMHGASFALMWTAGVQRAAELAPEGRNATSQGVFNATVGGLGATVGALLGGVLYDVLGAGGMFFALAALVAVASIPLGVRTARTAAKRRMASG